MSAINDTSANEHAELLEWVVRSGGVVDSRQTVRDFLPGVRGIFAAADIEAGAALVVVPWSLVVSGDLSGCETISALRLELSRGASSHLAPYVAHLAAHEPALPFTWSSLALDAVRELPPYRWLQHGGWYRQYCDDDSHVEESVSRWTQRALELYVARSAGVAEGAVMVPVYDLYNHGSGRLHNTVVEVDWGRTFSVRAGRDVRAGEQLYNSYGDNTGEMLRDYGFVEQEPQHWDFSEKGGTDCSFQIDGDTVEWRGRRPSLAQFDHATRKVAIELLREREFAPATEADARHLQLARRYRDAMRGAIERARTDIDRLGAADESKKEL